jgi:hypothetical protein
VIEFPEVVDGAGCKEDEGQRPSCIFQCNFTWGLSLTWVIIYNYIDGTHYKS